MELPGELDGPEEKEVLVEMEELERNPSDSSWKCGVGQKSFGRF